MGLLKSMGFDEIEIKEQIEQICIKNSIDYIIPMITKGNILFKDIFGIENLIINGKEVKEVKIYNDGIINKFTSLSFLNDKNILIFDDAFIKGNHILKTVSRFNDKITTSLIKENKNIIFNKNGNVANYTFYTIVQSIDKENNEDNKRNGNIIVNSYKTCSLEECYDFYIKEAILLQKNLYSSTNDLPIYKTTIDDVKILDSIFKSIEEIDFERTYTYIGNERINLGVLYLNKSNSSRIFNNFKLNELFDNLIIAATCKLRYEINENGQYDCVFTPNIFFKSMDYSNLESLFNSLFSSDLNNLNNLNNLDSEIIKKTSSKADMRLSFIKMYKYVNYVMSYIFGNLIKEYLSEYSIYFIS